MEQKYTKETILATIGIIGLCGGSCLLVATFPMDLFLWPGSRDITAGDRPELWIISLLLMIMGFAIFMYLWRDAVMIKIAKRRNRKDDWKL